MHRCLLVITILWLSLSATNALADNATTFEPYHLPKVCLLNGEGLGNLRNLGRTRPPCPLKNDAGSKRIQFSFRDSTTRIENFQDFSARRHRSNGRMFQTTGHQPLIREFLTADYALSYRDPWREGTMPQPASTQQANGQIRLHGKWAQNIYTAEWRYVGQNFSQKEGRTAQDQSEGKLSWSWKLPNLKPTIVLSKRLKNVEFNSLLPRTIHTEKSFSLRWSRPDWPILTMRHGRIQTTTHETTESSSPLTLLTKKSTGKLQYDQPTWSAFLETFMSTKENETRHHVETQSLGYSLGGEFSPFQAIHIAPTVGYRNDSQQTSQARIQSFSAQLNSSYLMGTSLTFTPDVRYQVRTDQAQNLRAESISASLLSQFTAKKYPLRLSLLGNFNSNRSSISGTSLQTLKLAFGLDKLRLDIFNLQHYKNILRLLIHHTQSLGITQGVQTSRGQTSGLMLLSFFP